MVRDDVPNETQRSVVLAFMQPGQEEVLRALRGAVPRDGASTLWEDKGTQRASTALEWLFPRPLASPELLEQVATWLRDSRPTRPPSATSARAPPTSSATWPAQERDRGARGARATSPSVLDTGGASAGGRSSGRAADAGLA